MVRSVAGLNGLVPALTEVFREYGYDGASLSRLCVATGLGKGSLYHFFPNGKEEMLASVLTHIDSWFQSRVFGPLLEAPTLAAALDGMFSAVDSYFQSGRRVCLVGVIALGDARDRFAGPVQGYFAHWAGTLADTLCRFGHAAPEAKARAEEVVAGIQGGIVLARALNDPLVFSRTLATLRARFG